MNDLAEKRAAYHRQAEDFINVIADDYVRVLEVEIERLRVLVSEAYAEGFGQSRRAMLPLEFDAEYAWTQSKARAALAAEKEGT